MTFFTPKPNPFPEEYRSRGTASRHPDSTRFPPYHAARGRPDWRLLHTWKRPTTPPDQIAEPTDHELYIQFGAGSSMLMLHSNPKIFANPEEFIPDRWVGEQGAKLLSDWVLFQEGSRRCIAIKYGR